MVGQPEAIEATTRQEIASSGENPNYTQNQCCPLSMSAIACFRQLAKGDHCP
jgi:hypothetical protein